VNPRSLRPIRPNAMSDRGREPRCDSRRTTTVEVGGGKTMDLHTGVPVRK
jgi:hypothetical protein